MAAGEVAAPYSATLWDRQVVAVTNSDSTLPLLTEAAERHTLDSIPGSTAVERAWGSYVLAMHPLPNVDPRRIMCLLVLNQSTHHAELRRSLRTTITLGVIALALSGLSLVLVLKRPLARLRRLAEVLPLLGSERFGELREELPGQWRTGPADEIDLLEAVSAEVAAELEKLHGRLEERAATLTRKVQELAAERNLTKRLFDNTELILLIHGEGGRVVRVNKFGMQLTGWTARDLWASDPYSWLHGDATVRERFAAEIASLLAGDRPSLMQEADISCVDGSRRNVIWRHARVADWSGDGPVVLSAGLDITNRREAEARLRWLAHHDAVTDLLNRKGFDVQAEQGLRASLAAGEPAALLAVDLVRFGQINKAVGYAGGDEVLIQVAEGLRGDLPDDAVCARASGGRFLALLPRCRQVDAERAATWLARSLAATSFYAGERVVRLAAIIGVALAPDNAKEVGALLACAEQAAGRPEVAGSSGFRLFEPDQTPLTVGHGDEAHQYVLDILESDRLTLHYQPILEIATMRVTHYEALVRAVGEEGRPAAPGDFLTAAERTGLLPEVDRRVMRLAMGALADGLLPAGALLCINLGAQTVSAPGFLAAVRELCQERSVDPRRMVIEIRESAAIRNEPGAAEVIHGLKSMGCGIALDDFGVAVASFEYLRELPIDYIKIDRDFVTHVLDRDEDRRLVHSMNEMAKGLGKKTVAEGVEDGATLAVLSEIGLDYAQGHHIGHPSATPDPGFTAPGGGDASAVPVAPEPPESRRLIN